MSVFGEKEQVPVAGELHRRLCRSLLEVAGFRRRGQPNEPALPVVAQSARGTLPAGKQSAARAFNWSARSNWACRATAPASSKRSSPMSSRSCCLCCGASALTNVVSCHAGESKPDTGPESLGPGRSPLRVGRVPHRGRGSQQDLDLLEVVAQPVQCGNGHKLSLAVFLFDLQAAQMTDAKQESSRQSEDQEGRDQAYARERAQPRMTTRPFSSRTPGARARGRV